MHHVAHPHLASVLRAEAVLDAVMPSLALDRAVMGLDALEIVGVHDRLPELRLGQPPLVRVAEQTLAARAHVGVQLGVGLVLPDDGVEIRQKLVETGLVLAPHPFPPVRRQRPKPPDGGVALYGFIRCL